MTLSPIVSFDSVKKKNVLEPPTTSPRGPLRCNVYAIDVYNLRTTQQHRRDDRSRNFYGQIAFLGKTPFHLTTTATTET
ncbi:unnamed protein product [Macrosiphum euphorbiae]|uniref:Uncharacterized protein n=1 Tax=Macrosiphum euphorbiae TaxID=13131 RepID=A0AAV0X0C3_9HEMI|nr:unnamed protein product [Macrosiphum euphorbiae]